MSNLITKLEVVGKKWIEMHSHNCPVLLRDGDNKSVGACWYYLKNGVCPSHGVIYESEINIHENTKMGLFSKIHKLFKGKK